MPLKSRPTRQVQEVKPPKGSGGGKGGGYTHRGVGESTQPGLEVRRPASLGRLSRPPLRPVPTKAEVWASMDGVASRWVPLVTVETDHPGCCCYLLA